MTDWTLIVLAGGGGVRLGGQDKARLLIDGRTLLDIALDGVPEGVPIIVAGPVTPTGRPVTFRQESPLAGGPVAGIAAACAGITSPFTVVLGVDMPWATTLIPVLLSLVVRTTAGVVLPITPDGRTQPLLSGWRTDSLRRALAHLDSERDASMSDLVEGATCSRWHLSAEQARLVDDIDTWDDLARAAALGRRPIG